MQIVRLIGFVLLVVLLSAMVVGLVLLAAENPTETIMLVLLMVALPLSFVFAAWQLARGDVFWTFIQLGQIKAIDRGVGNNIAVLANLKTHQVSGFEVISELPQKTFLEEKFGMYWIGFPPATVHVFEFVHERVNPGIGKETSSTEWIVRDKVSKQTSSLFWEVPHAYRFFGVELRDGFKVDVLFETRSQVVLPLTALYLRGGQFIDCAAQYVEAAVTGTLREFGSEDFRAASKKEGSDLAVRIIENVGAVSVRNAGLLEATGLVMIAGFISRYEVSDKTEEKALAQKQQARLKGEADILDAKLKADKAGEEGRRIERLAQSQKIADETAAIGQVAVFNTILESIMRGNPNVDPTVALEQATALAIATKMSAPTSPVVSLGNGMISITPTKKDSQ